jgi:cell division septation protein DedD
MAEKMAEKWYFCLVHQRVEPEVGCAHRDRLGPFDSRAEAAQALDRARERNERWAAEDRAWEGEEDPR